MTGSEQKKMMNSIKFQLSMYLIRIGISILILSITTIKAKDSVKSQLSLYYPSGTVNQSKENVDQVKNETPLDFYVILKRLIGNQKQKKHLFISDGWGPGGIKLKFPGENKSPDVENENNRKTNNVQTNSKKKNKQNYRFTWHIPGLFGEI